MPQAFGHNPDPTLESLSDQDLMLRVKANDFKAFETLFRRFEKVIFSYFARLSSDRNSAEDYTQEVFTRLWSHREMYQPTGKFTSYLFQIAHNFWVNELKRRTLRQPGPPLEDVLPYAEAKHRDDQPATVAVDRELTALLEHALAEIPDEQREVFLLCRYHKMRYQEIADLLNIPVRTVESRLVLATRKLMGKLAAYKRTG